MLPARLNSNLGALFVAHSLGRTAVVSMLTLQETRLRREGSGAPSD